MSYEQSKKKKRCKHPSRSDTTDISFASVTKGAFKGVGYSLAALIILSLICSALCLAYSDPAVLTFPVGLAVLYISSAIGGIRSGKALASDRSAAVFSGALCGFLMLTVTGIASAVMSVIGVPSNGLKLFPALLLRALCIVASVAGAYIGGQPKKRARKRR